MLVVSRKLNQTIVFPSLGIQLKVLRVAGKTVHIGVDAPDEVQILRGELSETTKYKVNTKSSSDASSSNLHELRKRMNEAKSMMKRIQDELAAGNTVEAERTLEMALDSFNELEDLVSLQSLPPIDVKMPRLSSHCVSETRSSYLFEDMELHVVS